MPSSEHQTPSASTATIILVPLAGSSSSNRNTRRQELAYIPRSQRNYQDIQDEAALKHQDPFLFYSDDRRKMEYLLGGEDCGTIETLPSTRFVQRKSRISFEVSETLAMEGMFDDLAMFEDDDEDDFFLALAESASAAAAAKESPQQGSPQVAPTSSRKDLRRNVVSKRLTGKRGRF